MMVLPRSFTFAFFGEVAPLLVNSLCYPFKVGELSTSQKQTVITLTEKRLEIRDLSKTGDLFRS